MVSLIKIVKEKRQFLTIFKVIPHKHKHVLKTNDKEVLINSECSNSNNNSHNNVNKCFKNNNIMCQYRVNDNICDSIVSYVAEGASENQKSSDSHCEPELGCYVSICAHVSGESNDRRPDINCLQSSECSASYALAGPDIRANRELLLNNSNEPGEGQRLGNGAQDKFKRRRAWATLRIEQGKA
jgi:hypothetical protein